MNYWKKIIAAAVFLATFTGLPNIGCAQTNSIKNFVNLVKEAQAKSAANNWKSASELLNQVVQTNPVEVKFWQKLGEVQYCFRR